MGDLRLGSADTARDVVLLEALSEVRDGNFAVRLPLEWTGVQGKIADRLNEVIAANQSLQEELARVSRLVGHEGRLSQRLALPGSGRVWAHRWSRSTV